MTSRAPVARVRLPPTLVEYDRSAHGLGASWRENFLGARVGFQVVCCIALLLWCWPPPRQDLDYVRWDYGDLGRQIASSFERAAAFHRWNVGEIRWHTMD